MKLDTFTTAYIECALWASTDDDGNPLEDNYGVEDISRAALNQIISDCDAFQTNNAEILALAGDDVQNGHDYWLTRNRHGAGFWDRGYDLKVSTALTDAAHADGACDFYVDDDGELRLN
jgi:hypothetical protein